MIEHPIKHGSPEWHAARMGIPTASNFHRLITKGGKPSAQAEDYLHALLFGRFVGECGEDFSIEWTIRGSALEASAISAYEFETDLDTRECGFFTLDDGSAGCTPDRAVGDDGLLEIKCPAGKEHVAYALGLEPQYVAQVQGQLWITEREWCDFMSFSPAMPSAIVRVRRDEKFIATLAEIVAGFNEKLAAAEAKLMRYGWRKPRTQDEEIADARVWAESVGLL